MIIPHEMLSPEALQGIIEAFVTREGTDYGSQDVSLATKVLQVRQQLDAGTAVMVYDESTESCTIQPTNQLPDHLEQTVSRRLTECRFIRSSRGSDEARCRLCYDQHHGWMVTVGMTLPETRPGVLRGAMGPVGKGRASPACWCMLQR